MIEKQEIENRIFTIRGLQVMLDSHLAELYGVETKILNQAVKRNIERFPEAFRFQLNAKETENLRSQIVTSSSNNQGLRFQNDTLKVDDDLRSQNVTLENLRFQNGTSSVDYPIGAPLKEVGRKWIAFSKMDT